MVTQERSWDSGETLWKRGEVTPPLRILRGILAYRRGAAAIGLLGPGELALPLPGVLAEGPAAADLMAITEARTVPVDLAGSPPSSSAVAASVLAVVTAADRLGNFLIPERLAAVLLEITGRTGESMVRCRQDILALAVGARRETLSTLLSDWRDAGWVETRYRGCRVRDRGALEQVRAGDPLDAIPRAAGGNW